MLFDKAKIIILLICCFLGASIIAFLLKKDGNLVLKDKPPDKAGKHELQESKAKQHQPTQQNKEALNTANNEPETQSDNIEDLEALLGDMIEGDISDLMDMEWSSREITSDFSDRNKVAEVIGQFPIVSDIVVSEEQLDLLRNCATEMIFNNGNNDHDSYLNFVRKSGETVSKSDLTRFIGGGIPEKEIRTDPWGLLSKDLNRLKLYRTPMWKGLVFEGSEIKIFEAQTSKLPLGEDLRRIRGAIHTFRDRTDPPVSLDEMLKTKGKVMMADVQVFIAHNDKAGGVVWPYMIRYWFDPINSSWRVQRAVLFRNRHRMYPIYVLP